jgi:4-oxalocrotonate tautomerase
MPVITFEGGKLTVDQKRQLIKEFSERATAITGVPKQFMTVMIREQEDNNLGMGGKSVAEIKEGMKK